MKTTLLTIIRSVLANSKFTTLIIVLVPLINEVLAAINTQHLPRYVTLGMTLLAWLWKHRVWLLELAEKEELQEADLLDFANHVLRNQEKTDLPMNERLKRWRKLHR